MKIQYDEEDDDDRNEDNVDDIDVDKGRHEIEKNI